MVECPSNRKTNMNSDQKRKTKFSATPLTYISLFSSAGVGCFGFKENGFECIATNELIERRLNIQKVNNKCRYESGYICGDITKDETKQRLKSEISLWKNNHNIQTPDVIIATPPCQGMSVANHKKTADEIKRNSLVVESILLIEDIKPKVFIFENVAAFLKTSCVDTDDSIVSILESINKHLSEEYTIHSDVINFKNYGSKSSRTRTIVIGVLKKYANVFSPEELFPRYQKEQTLREVIGDLPRLKVMGEISKKDILHSFRKYDDRMRCWISDLKEGESAFDNHDKLKQPHQLMNGAIIPNKRKNGDKYTRQCWNKVAPCVHTRNDQLASQSTVHPTDDRVFSIRELMRMMSIPEEFKWFRESYDELNKLPYEQKVVFLKKEEINIRQSIGEAVPTGVFSSIAKNIKKRLSGITLTENEIKNIIDKHGLKSHENLRNFLEHGASLYNLKTISSIAEYANAFREENAAYYTDTMLLHSIYNALPTIEKDKILVLEPSVGVGSFLPIISKKYASAQEIEIDCVDIDSASLEILRFMINQYDLGDNIKINLINQDFLSMNLDRRYDLAIGNPPFGRLAIKKNMLTSDYYNMKSKNISSYFLEKCLAHSDNVVMIMPKNILNTSDFDATREFVSNYSINRIIDFGEFGFKGVLIETICLSINTISQPKTTTVLSLPLDISKVQKQSYITSKNLPYWIIYRNDYFDNFISNLELDVFDVFRDRQLTNSNMKAKTSDKIRIIKSRNISDDGEIIDIVGYDSFIDRTVLNKYAVSKYLDDDDVYITPNMTYKTRLMKKPKNTAANGSVAILIPKRKIAISKDAIRYFASKEYREYMQIARNYQTRTLNVDNNSVYFYGIKKGTTI